jgi:hypothetical protein
MYQFLKYLHVIAAFTFIMGHGASVAFSFRLKREKEISRIQAMLDLSASMWVVSMLSLLLILIIGIILSFMGDWWSEGWIWTSMISFIVVTVWMFYLGQKEYHPLRKAYGMPYRDTKGEHPAEEPASEEERAELIAKTKPHLMMLIAYGGFAIVLWLMMYKPF